MADDKQPMQADGGGTAPETDGPDGNGELASRRGGLAQTGESGGGAYPNPHSGKGDSADGPDKFMGHGGQTDIKYRGGLGGGENAATEEDQSASSIHTGA